MILLLQRGCRGKGAPARFPCTPNPRRPASALLRTISLDDSELMPAVGQAILNYLRKGRPQTSLREVFIKVNAPLGPFARGSSLYTVFGRRIRQAGIKSEEHTFELQSPCNLVCRL